MASRHTRDNALNFLLFLVLATGLYFLWGYAERHWLPQPAKRDDQARKKPVPNPEEERTRKDETEEKRVARAAVIGMPPAVIEPPRPRPPITQQNITAPRERPRLIALGDDNFYIRCILTTEGGGVQQLILTKFQEADRLGRSVPDTPLHLIPGVIQRRPYYLAETPPPVTLTPGMAPSDIELAAPSFTIFHYPTPDDKHPDPLLGETQWKIVAEERPETGPHLVTFEAELGEPYFVRFRKTYTLGPRDYHVGLKLEIERLPGCEKGKGLFRYQITGPRGLPIEGEWYNTTYRVALVGWNDRKGIPRRQYEAAAGIAVMRGGDAVPKAENTFKYMAVATQFFASAVAIDDTAEGAARNPWAYVRATTELPFDKKADSNLANFHDVTVRAASDTIDLAPGERITHSYLLYNGPAKVRLLGFMESDRTVDQGLVDRYQHRLGLSTITDYQSPTWLGSFANAIWWVDLVIAFTNLMHWLLALIHRIIPWWAISIIVLTVFVRLLLHYPSKKQTQVNMKMVEVQKRLAPQLEELKKKYANDPQGFQRAKMQLFLANGVNPFAAMGGCLLLFAQMPVLMGLYFCLQESVFFRLEQFLWIENLAAPDMALWWSEKIPWISTPDNLGGILYLGPYLNVLPLLAVGLMIWQQNKMMPPPTDEQTAAQQRMMKIMMFMMAILFYKVAAGLAVYFIVSTIWGLVERQLIHQPISEETKPAVARDAGSAGKAEGSSRPPAPEPKPKGFFARLMERVEELRKQADEQSRRQIRNPISSESETTGPRRERKKKKRK